MKERKEEGIGGFESKREMVPRAAAAAAKFRFISKSREEESVTKKEIAKFWRQRRIVEEDHLLAAIKTAARLRARNLTENEYRRFELTLEEEDEPDKETMKRAVGTNYCDKDDEVRVGVNNWWTKSKYAYLNQPALVRFNGSS